MIKYSDRTAETTTSTGTGSLTLAGAQAGYQSFNSGIGDAAQCYYCVTNGTDWEVGQGTYTHASTSLSRDGVLSSSNAGSLVNWGSGTKDVFIVHPAVAAKTLELNNTGLRILDTDNSHTLSIVPGSNLTADRTLTLVTGDAARSLTLSADATISGTNTGDQTITLTGAVSGTGTGSFATSYNEAVPVNKGGTGQTALGTANQVLGVDADGLLSQYKSLIAGDNVTITHGVGSITIAAAASGGGGGGGLSAVRIYTSSGTWTKPSGLTKARVIVIGGGGGGMWGASGSPPFSAPGGGAGGVSIKTILDANLGSSETVTVGSGGSGGVNAGADPTAGGTSSFGSHCSSNGGGVNTGYGFGTAGGLGGSASGGDNNLTGSAGGPAYFTDSSSRGSGGFGGQSVFGGAGAGGSSTSGVSAGKAATGYGSGGGGAKPSTASGANGGAGAAGVVIVEEYI